MIHRGPFQPLPFCGFVSPGALCTDVSSHPGRNASPQLLWSQVLQATSRDPGHSGGCDRLAKSPSEPRWAGLRPRTCWHQSCAFGCKAALGGAEAVVYTGGGFPESRDDLELDFLQARQHNK